MSGLGVYPGDPCYDPDRPDWLPYWLDDFTESDCKWGATNIAGATVNAFENPEEVATNVGGVVGQGTAAAVSDVGAGVAQAGSSFLGNLSGTGIFAMVAIVIGGMFLMGALRR
jgi:hypothetical protein